MNAAVFLKRVIKNLLLLTLPSLILIIICLEVFVRLTWDERRGTPNFVIQHATRGFVLAPNYTGYFADQPVRINSLGFRDNKEYEVEKGDNVFRIMVLGDSVTFGYGVKFEETWPYLFQQKLEKWNPETDWQV